MQEPSYYCSTLCKYRMESSSSQSQYIIDGRSTLVWLHSTRTVALTQLAQNTLCLFVPAFAYAFSQWYGELRANNNVERMCNITQWQPRNRNFRKIILLLFVIGVFELPSIIIMEPVRRSTAQIDRNDDNKSSTPNCVQFPIRSPSMVDAAIRSL